MNEVIDYEFKDQIFEMFNKEGKNAIPEDMEFFHKRLDKYLRGCAEHISMDFGFSASEWYLLTDNYLDGDKLQADHLSHFYRFAFIKYREDTFYLMHLLKREPSIFLSRAMYEIERTYRSLLTLWCMAIDCIQARKKDSAGLGSFWESFSPIIEEYKEYF